MRLHPQTRPVRHQRQPWRRRDPRPVPATISAMLATIPSLPRPMLDRLTAAMIDRMDMMDGDLDIEANGDELDGNNAEDEFMTHRPAGDIGMPGCPISDPDTCAADIGEDDRDADM